jgi:hypothetical protein
VSWCSSTPCSLATLPRLVRPIRPIRIAVAAGGCQVRLRLGGRSGARWCPAGGGVSAMAGLGAELGYFVAIGVGLAFGAFGSGPQVGAQFVAVLPAGSPRPRARSSSAAVARSVPRARPVPGRLGRIP